MCVIHTSEDCSCTVLYETWPALCQMCILPYIICIFVVTSFQRTVLFEKVFCVGRYEILGVVLLTIQMFWNQTPCYWVSSSIHFERSWCLHLEGQAGYWTLRPWRWRGCDPSQCQKAPTQWDIICFQRTSHWKAQKSHTLTSTGKYEWL